jgi:hypothetical protein
VHVGAGAGNDPRGKSRRIELVLCVEIEGDVHCLHPGRWRRLAVQQPQEVSAYRIVVRIGVDAAAIVAVVVPIEQHGAERRNQLVGDIARARDVVSLRLRHDRSEGRASGAHHVHGVGRCRNVLQHRAQFLRQSPQRAQPLLVGGKLGPRRQPLVDQQVRDLLEFAPLRDIQNVVTAVMEIVAAAPDRAQGRGAGLDPGERYGLLGLEDGFLIAFAHRFSPAGEQ